MKNCLLIFLLLLSAHVSLAQSDNQPLRIELDARPNTEPFDVIPMGNQGLLVMFKTNEFEDRNFRRWVFVFYDSQLELQWEFIQPIIRNHEFSAYAFSKQRLSILFYDHRASETNFQILNIFPASKQLSLVEGTVDRKFELTRFARNRSHAFIGMNTKDACQAYSINLETGETTALELNPDGGSYIENMQTDTLSGQLLILTSLRNERRRNALYLHRFGTNLTESEFIPLIRNENRKMVTSAQYIPLSNNDFMVLGSYTSNPTRRGASGSDPAGSKSTGFYRIYSGKTPQVDFYSFSTLVNVENYIRGTVAEQRQRSLWRLFQGRGSSHLEHYMVIHRVMEYNDYFLLSGEAFSPDFRTVTTIAYDYYGRPVPRTYSVFDGYRYSHAVVVAFDNSGRLLWDNGMEMINIRTFDLYPKLVLYPEEDGLAMAYNHDGKIAWKQVNEYQTITNVSYANIETRYSKDRINSEQSSRLFYWYDHYFLATGYQTIINNYLPSQNRRSVFYINKIAFD